MNAATHSMQRWRLAKNATVTALLSLCPLATSLLIVEGSHPRVASAADDFNMAVTTNGIRLGNYISGPPLAADSLTNRVVMLEFWGVNCPPCLASMPKLEQLHKQLSPLGLVVIGAHAQGGPDPVVLKTAADLGVTFTILSDASVAEGGDLGGIPHCMLFDHTGKCIYRGSPFSVQEAVAAAEADLAVGRRIIPPVANRPTGMLFGLQSSLHPFFTHPTYRKVADLPLAERVAALRSAEVRQALVAEEPATRNPIARGLMRGLELAVDAQPVVDAALKAGLLVNRTAERVVRMLPPLTVTKTELEEAIGVLDGALASVKVKGSTVEMRA